MSKPLWSGTCPDTGKRCYPDRRTAKRAARGLKGRKGHVNAYPCGDHWHFGHLPDWVINGQIPRSYLKKETG